MKVLMVSLGCDKNLVDSEVMLGLLHKAGHEITNDEHEAEAVVINTCAFIKDAQEESINTIIEYGELKKTGSLKKLIVTGCLSQRYKDDILAELPEIEPHVRDVFLLWLSKALENKHFRGKTESGEIYYIENADTKETCMLHAKDGILQMPAYTIRFEEKK